MAAKRKTGKTAKAQEPDILDTLPELKAAIGDGQRMIEDVMDGLLKAEVLGTMSELKTALQKCMESQTERNLKSLWTACSAMQKALETEGTVEVVPAPAFADPKTLTVTVDPDGTASLFINGGHLGVGVISGIKIVRAGHRITPAELDKAKRDVVNRKGKSPKARRA